ncbi:hypothetical protein CLHUN_40080 [Ruminiclostridium hungatei]|uniref:Hemerythrin-like domain-containing protein n=1 Tax=Ruminiclostridium hungatei TaxID=48256 RepID=A0A1V4SED7_RUMHU|nr:hemerythrin domain-containing protein [Ruminiclostridium hungatei]OPX42103.1 hypothetical protein CLHUN_40080 [Ruminiclostridium hungatei]
MISVASLKRQHEEISEVIGNIRSFIAGGKVEAGAHEVALLINTLAGKLNIHLNTEDKYMYPGLLESETEELKVLAREYMGEMGAISHIFLQYKEKFNTRSKILSAQEAFITESQKVFDLLEKRVEREETSLYTIL